MIIRKFFYLFLLIIGCSSDGLKKERDTIKIGGLAPLTGVDAAWGEVVATTFKYAEDEINSEGGVLGKPLEIIICDYGESPEGVKMCLQRFISRGIKIIVGPDASETLISGVCRWDEQEDLEREKKCPFVSENKILVMGTWPTSPIISNIEDGGFIFRICPSDEFQAKVLANHIISKEIKKISVIYRDDWDGREFSKVLTEEITKLGGEILSAVPYPPDKTENFKEDVNELYRKGDPDGIFLYTFGKDGINLLVELRNFILENRKNTPKLFGCDCNQFPEISGGPAGDLVKGNMEGTTISPPGDDPDYESFRKKLIDRFGDEGAVDFLTYDAVYVIAAAIESAGTYESDKVKDKIVEVTNGGEIVKPPSADGGSWKLIKEKIKSGLDIDYKGVSGDVDFTQNGDIRSSTYIIWRIKETKREWSDFEEIESVKVKDGKIEEIKEVK